MNEVLKEIWTAKFKKAKEREFDISSVDIEKEIDLLKLKIDMSLDIGNIEEFKKLSGRLKSLKSFLILKANNS